MADNNFRVKNGLEVGGVLVVNSSGELQISPNTGYNNTNWDTAYGWGNHASAGYLTSYTDTNTTYSAGTGITLTGTTFSLTDTNAKLNLTGGTLTGNLVVEDSEVHVGDISGDSWTRIKHAQADGYGFDFVHNNATVLVNEQGTTNEALVLGDVDANNSHSGLFGVSHSSNGGVSWTKKLDLRGDGDLYVGSSAQNKVWHEGTLTTTNKSNWDTAYGWGDHSTQSYATQAYVGTAISNLVDTAPATLDTLNELAAALGDDPNFATTVTNSIATKLPLTGGTITGDLSVTGKAILNRANASVGAPNTANHDTGTRIELYNTSATAWYAIGIESNTMWFNSDDHYRFYTDAVSKVDFDSSGVVNAVGGYKVNGTTVIDSSRNIGNVNAISIGQDISGMDTANLDLDIVNNASIRGSSSLYFGVTTNNYNSWKTRISSNNTSTMYISGQAVEINDFGYGSSVFGLFNSGGLQILGNTAWHAGNDGSGSGLDADLLDGQHGSYYAPNSSLGNYLPLAGGTLTGNLIINNADASITINDNSGSPTDQGIRIRAESIDTNLPNSEGLGIIFEQSPTNGSPDTTPAVITTGEFYSQSSQRVFHDAYHPNADTLTTARTINGVSFNGSANITVADATKLPLTGGTLTGILTANAGIALGNTDITGVNALSFNDPGPNEGIAWSGGNTKIYESPDDLTTNTAGNLQFVYGSTRRLTVNSTGIDVTGTATMDGLTVEGSSAVIASFARDGSDGDAIQIFNGGVGTTKALGLGGVGNNGIITNQYGNIQLAPSGTTRATISATGIDVTGTATMDGLTVDGASSSQQITFSRTVSSAGTGKIGSDVSQAMGIWGTDGTKVATFYQNKDLALYEDTGTTPKFFWDASAESLGIGTNAPSSVLELSKATYPLLTITQSTTGQSWQLGNDGSNLYVYNATGSSRVLDIDSSGRVGINTSSPSSFSSNANNLVVGSGSGTEGITINSGSANYGTIYFADGTSGSAAYAGNINYNHADNSMRLGTNGSTTDVVIDSSGRVGIGTSSPSAPLTVNNNTDHSDVAIFHAGGGTPDRGLKISTFSNTNTNAGVELDAQNATGAFKFSTGGTERMRITSVGNVGIGTTAPSSQLHLHKDAGTAYLKQTNTANGQTLEIGNAYSLYTGANGAHSAIASDLVLAFATADTERMRIDASGKVGIGNISPEKKLTIGSSQGEGIQFTYDGTNNYRSQILTYWTSNIDSRMDFNIARSSGVTPATIMSVGYGENVGIGTTTPGYKLEVNGSFAATTKSFVIDHPTKEDMKLRYGSLEGPENGVYVRGRLKDSNVIELPDYWTGLVHEDSITVSLTAIGKSQELYVIDINDNKVTVGGNDSINCFYTIFAERKDVEKLKVEYK